MVDSQCFMLTKTGQVATVLFRMLNETVAVTAAERHVERHHDERQINLQNRSYTVTHNTV